MSNTWRHQAGLGKSAFPLWVVGWVFNINIVSDSLEDRLPCEERAGGRSTLPPCRGLGEVERRCGGGHPSSESVQHRPYSACVECSRCAGR